ncbi:MAG: carboxypeptidase-like regulatory domain-containing protein, partial [Muribaculaceae bacterium]|nr:carboxypeptidase-like regulatory domain-containing protein [Muribaculaceae bacterium]
MKKTIMTAMLSLAVALGAGAQEADQLRVYINPGHGGWTPNDRPCSLVGHATPSRNNTDTLAFFESNTNLQKALGLMERLIDYGFKFDRSLNQSGEESTVGAARDLENNIVLSRVKCGPYHSDNGAESQMGASWPSDGYIYNRSLTEISAEVEANNFDVFISIHSNAMNDGDYTNFPLYLYRGYNNCRADEGNLDADFQKESRRMAELCWPYSFENPHSVWTDFTATRMNLCGDIDFYGKSSAVAGSKGYLGVLKHTTPGFLVEGYFHTYHPARHRAMNNDVSRVEGVAYARGVADYFGLERESFGTIYGIVRDAHTKFADKAYIPNPKSDDVYLPLNGVTVILKKDEVEVARYETDEYYNGAYVFDRVEEGNYTISFSHPDYLEGEELTVTVKAGETLYPKTFLTDKEYEEPPVIYENYPDPLASFSSFVPADEYSFTTDFSNVAIPGLEGQVIRRVIARDGRLYVLAHDKKYEYAAVLEGDARPVVTLLVYDLKDKKVLANVSTAGTHGSLADLSDIQLTADGYLLGCNQTKTQDTDNEIQAGDEGRGTFIIYKWANDEDGLPTGDPDAWLTLQDAGNWYRAYPGHFAYSGTTVDGMAVVNMPSITAPNHMLRNTLITITDGVADGGVFNQSPNSWGEPVIGMDYNMFTSPLEDDHFYMIGSGEKGIAEFSYHHGDKKAELSNGNSDFLSLKAPGQVGIFKYAGRSYVVVPAYDENGVAGVKLVDMTNNISSATIVPIYNTEVAGAAGSVATFGEVEIDRDVMDVPTGAFVTLYMLRDGKLTKFTTRGVKQPVHRAAFAYGLNVEEGEDSYTISYSLSDDVASVTFVATPVGGGEDVTVELGAASKGSYTAQIDRSSMEADVEYNWSINVVNKPNVKAEEVFCENYSKAVRGGIVAITDPEAESFGYITVAHGAAAGFDVYTPAGELVASGLHKGHELLGGSSNKNESDLHRGHERDGLAVFAGLGDKASGLVAFNPADYTAEPFTLYGGTKESAGHYMLNGENLGGNVAGLCFTESGDDTKLFTFSQDHEGKNGAGDNENMLVVYPIGTSWQITSKPNVGGHKWLLANRNVDLVAYGTGFFGAQI